MFLLILSITDVSGCISHKSYQQYGGTPIGDIYHESPIIVGEISDESGEYVRFSEPLISNRNVTFDLNSETIKIIIQNQKTREPIVGARVVINWISPNRFNSKDGKPLNIYLFDDKFTNPEGEVLFSKSNAKKMDYNNTEVINSRISSIYVLIDYQGVKANLSIQEIGIEDSKNSQYLSQLRYPPANEQNTSFSEIMNSTPKETPILLQNKRTTTRYSGDPWKLKEGYAVKFIMTNNTMNDKKGKLILTKNDTILIINEYPETPAIEYSVNNNGKEKKILFVYLYWGNKDNGSPLDHVEFDLIYQYSE